MMLKNNQEAKFEQVLHADREGGARGRRPGATSSFDAFFTHILMHELMHGLGPHNITVGGRADDRAAGVEGHLQHDRGSQGRHLGPLRAAVPGRPGKLDKSLDQTMYTTFLASMFRSIRFGINEAHGRGVAIQLNYLLDNGGVTVAPDGTFAVDPERIKQNVIDLTRDIMTLQAMGDYAAAKQMIEKLGVVRPQVQAVLDRLKGVPVDIEPRFVTAEQLLSSTPNSSTPNSQ